MSQLFELSGTNISRDNLGALLLPVRIDKESNAQNSQNTIREDNSFLAHFCVVIASAPQVNFSSCQQNLIKIFQIESMIALITKMTLIFSSHLLNGQKQLSKKAGIFRNFRNKSCSILMLHKISKNKKCAPRLIFFYKFFFYKDLDDF